MILKYYRLTLLTAVFIFLITLPAKGQIKFPSYKLTEKKYSTATQPEAQAKQFYSITSEEGQATIQMGKKQYNPTIVPNTTDNNHHNYSTNGLKLSTDKAVKSYGGGTGTTGASGKNKTNNTQANTNINAVSLPILTYSREQNSKTDDAFEQRLYAYRDDTENGPQRLPSEPGDNPDLPIAEGTPFLILCAIAYTIKHYIQKQKA